jgi:hypothetical protein
VRLAAFARQRQNANFDQITVRRMNIVEPDGEPVLQHQGCWGKGDERDQRNEMRMQAVVSLCEETLS